MLWLFVLRSWFKERGYAYWWLSTRRIPSPALGSSSAFKTALGGCSAVYLGKPTVRSNESYVYFTGWLTEFKAEQNVGAAITDLCEPRILARLRSKRLDAS